MNLLCSGLPWRILPLCFPPVSTVQRWFYLSRNNEFWQTLDRSPLIVGRENLGPETSPSAGVI